MSLQSVVLNGALDAVAHFNPDYRPFIDWIKTNEGRIGELLPVIDVAIKQGGSAWKAVERDAPDLASAIKDFLATAHPDATPARESVSQENIVRTCFGFQRMTPDQERRWMDGTTVQVNGG